MGCSPFFAISQKRTFGLTSPEVTQLQVTENPGLSACKAHVWAAHYTDCIYCLLHERTESCMS